MKQLNSQKELGDKVLAAVRLPDEKIEQIVASPDLFARIRAAAQEAHTPVKIVKARRMFPVLLWQGASVAILMVLLAGGVWIYRMLNVPNQTPVVSESFSEQAAPSIQAPETQSVAAVEPEPARLVQKTTAIVHSRRNEIKRPPSPKQREEEMGEFQALTYLGAANDRAEDARIVRVELSRSSLLAMGIDVPSKNESDNGSDRVKADLLIDFDGVMKAVRLEKKVLGK